MRRLPRKPIVYRELKEKIILTLWSINTEVVCIIEVIYAVEIDNTSNTLPTYVKLWNNDNASAGTTKPTLQFRVLGGVKETYIIGTGTSDVFVELSFWAVKSPYALSADDSDAAVSPASSVQVKILCT